MKVLGVWPVRIGVDSITLDERGEWLYYGPFTGDRLYRIRTRDLNDATLAPDALAATGRGLRAEDDQRRASRSTRRTRSTSPIRSTARS
jgi:hypothetical protein